ncbi:MAG: ORF6N domain-containing protein [Candidatus Omnitrophota bacterium]
MNIIQKKIVAVRNVQVMLDSDLAKFYGVETKVLNQAVKRNIERFPEEFMFQLAEQEASPLRSQAVTSKGKGGRRYLPYVFTEQGVAMLSAVLKSETAVNVSIWIMRAFVATRRIIALHAQILPRLKTLEQKQITYQTETDRKFDLVFQAIEQKEEIPDKGIFFDGQIFDAYKFISDIIRKAEKSIVLIDNYVDDTVLTLFSKRKTGVSARILTKNISKQLRLDIKKNNEQYPEIIIEEFKDAHDRFLIVDEDIVYHLGASLKDLGKKIFAFSRFGAEALALIKKTEKK